VEFSSRTLGNPHEFAGPPLFLKFRRHFARGSHDLDFSALLAATKGKDPSVIQIRTQNILPEAIGTMVIAALKQYQNELELGAIITIEPQRARVRILPLSP